MNKLTITEEQCARIDAGEQIELTYNGFEMYAVADPYGDWQTPAGTHFTVNFYAPSCYDLDVYCNDECLTDARGIAR